MEVKLLWTLQKIKSKKSPKICIFHPKDVTLPRFFTENK